MDFLTERKQGEVRIYYVLGESRENMRLAQLIRANHEAVTVIDPRYSGGELRNGISYTNMEIAKSTFDIPDNLFFYSYMDPVNRKL